MSEDFCTIHGMDHMKSSFGNPVSHCEQCEKDQAKTSEIAKYRNSLLWAVDYFGVDRMSSKERAHGVLQLANVLRGDTNGAATYQPNEWDDSAKLISKLGSRKQT